MTQTVKSVTVIHLGADETLIYVGIPAREAVIAAYAQSLGDLATWEYAIKYAGRVIESELTVSCGDFCALKERHVD